MQVDSDSLSSLWDNAWRKAPEGANTFYEYLDGELATKYALNDGSSPSSISRNNSSTSYALGSPTTETLKQQEAVRVHAKRLYRNLARELGFTLGEITDAQELVIYNAGVDTFDAAQFAEYRSGFADCRP